MYLKHFELKGFCVKPYCIAEVYVTENTSCKTKIILLTKVLYTQNGNVFLWILYQ